MKIKGLAFVINTVFSTSQSLIGVGGTPKAASHNFAMQARAEEESSGWNNVPPKKKNSRPRRGPTLPPSWFLELEPADNSTESNDFEPFMLMLMGFPGSGKSTVARKLQELMPKKYVRINQDELKTRKNCLARAAAVMKEGKCPVIDRCNAGLDHRKPFRKLAAEHRYPVDCLVLDVPQNECVARCQARSDHPSLQPQDARRVMGYMRKDWKQPQPYEKFRHVWCVNMSSEDGCQELRQVMEEFLLA